MIKMVYCVKKRSDISSEAFRDYWLNQHGPRVKRHAPAVRMKKYIQSHTLESPVAEMARGTRGMTDSYDGITECWWESLDDLIDALQTPEGAAANEDLARDEANFVDLAASCIFFTEEHTIFNFSI